MKALLLGYGSVLLIGLSIGSYATMRLYTAKEVRALKAEITRVQDVNKTLAKAAQDYEERRQARQESKVVYVEKPVYRECRPAIEWLQQFNGAVEADNAGELVR